MSTQASGITTLPVVSHPGDSPISATFDAETAGAAIQRGHPSCANGATFAAAMERAQIDPMTFGQIIYHRCANLTCDAVGDWERVVDAPNLRRFDGSPFRAYADPTLAVSRNPAGDERLLLAAMDEEQDSGSQWMTVFRNDACGKRPSWQGTRLSAPGGGTNIDQTSFAVDPLDGLHVFLASSARDPSRGNQRRVWLAESFDGGETFPTVRWASDPASGREHFHPRIAVSPTGAGFLALAYGEGNFPATDTMFQLFLQVSRDQGASWPSVGPIIGPVNIPSEVTARNIQQRAISSLTVAANDHCVFAVGYRSGGANTVTVLDYDGTWRQAFDVQTNVQGRPATADAFFPVLTRQIGNAFDHQIMLAWWDTRNNSARTSLADLLDRSEHGLLPSRRGGRQDLCDRQSQCPERNGLF